MDDSNAPQFVDHREEHEEGRCEENCPWCIEEAYDLGGEGGDA